MPEGPEMTADLPKYDPFDPSDADCDRDILSRLRTDAPIHQVLPGYFLVTRHDDVAAVELDPITFEQTALTPASVGAFENDPERRRLGELDPPQHGQIRRHLAMYVTPGRLRRFEPMIREVARDLVRKFADSDSVRLDSRPRGSAARECHRSHGSAARVGLQPDTALRIGLHSDPIRARQSRRASRRRSLPRIRRADTHHDPDAAGISRPDGR